MFYMVYHLYISNAPAPKTVHSKSNTTTKIAAPNFMRVFYAVRVSPDDRREEPRSGRYAGCKSAAGNYHRFYINAVVIDGSATMWHIPIITPYAA